MTIRPNFPLTTADVFALTFTGNREAVHRLVRLEDAALHLRAATGCPEDQATRIVRTLGAEATHALAGLTIAHGVPLEAIAAAITGGRGAP